MSAFDGLAGLTGFPGLAAEVTARATDVELVSVPDLPANCTVAEAAGAEAVADSVTCCGVPAESANEAGEAVTPEGTPAMATWMDCEKPLLGVAAIETLCEEPAVRVSVPGLAESEKPAGADVAAAVTETVTLAVLMSDPDVPANCNVAVSAGAEATAVRLTCWGEPGMRVKLEGDTLTPAGVPLTAT